ncbi:MAG: cupin domain-containing protein [Acidobacteria bacterium]|nr:MAG: cupin domain-containing protein [Acidobacteriota bacterium]
MIARREVNSSLAALLGGLFLERAGTPLRAAAQQISQDAQGHMQHMRAIGIHTLMEEPLAEMPNSEVTVLTLTIAPGGSSQPHKHTGPVFAYLLDGEIENQVDPDPPRSYKPGEFFYEPPMHIHRSLRNLSSTKPAKLLIFQVGEKGKQFTLSAK